MRASATGRVLQDPKGGSFWFDAGAVCLDFAHTGGEGAYAMFETLHEPADLGEWLAEPPLAAVTDGPRDGPRADRGQGAPPGDLGRGARPGGAAPAPRGGGGDHQPAAAAAPLVPELGPGGTTAGWAPPVRATQALSTLAREMIELLSGPLAERIRECASDNCPLVFVDSSRPGARRWCAMERCGNRNKLRAHRARQA